VLAAGTRVSIAMLVVAFACYVAGIVPPYVPITVMPRYWILDATAYARLAHVPHGWGWAPLIVYGDFLNFAGIVVLAGLPIVGYLALLRVFVRRGDVVSAVIAVAQVAVLLFAASGLVGGGH
jgi:hypothetical protein